MHNDDDHLAFIDHLPPSDQDISAGPCWHLLIVDDDDDVHHATEFALSDLRVLGRPLEFLHAFSAAHAITILERRRDVAVILLPERFLGLGRLDPDDPAGPVGMTPLALRAARSTNGVSRRHGEVAREMWQPLFGGAVDDVPITHVTNGVHVPTWLGPDMKALFDRHLGDGWLERADDPDTWRVVDDISDEELWSARSASRARLVDLIRRRSASDRLRRGEEVEYAEAAAVGFDPDRLTIGFPRRLAAYKRLNLLTIEPQRALGLLTGERSLQFVFAGKAHPLDEGAKAILARTFELLR